MSEETRYRKLLFLGFPKYKVGTDGSFWRWRKHGGWVQRKVNSQGGVTLCRTVNGVKEKKCYRLGNLVLRAFVGEPPPGTECCHDPDWNPTNNKLTNLRWGTHKENMEDRKRHGRHRVRPTCKINQKIADQIRQLHAKRDRKNQEIANLFGISLSTLYIVVAKKRWSESK